MASRRQQTKRGRQKLILAVGVTVLIILIVLIVGLTTFLKKYSPSKEVTDYKEYYSLSEDDELFVVYDNEQVQNHAILQDDEVYINYQTVHKYLNKRFYWDATEQVLRYVTPDGDSGSCDRAGAGRRDVSVHVFCSEIYGYSL